MRFSAPNRGLEQPEIVVAMSVRYRRLLGFLTSEDRLEELNNFFLLGINTFEGVVDLSHATTYREADGSRVVKGQVKVSRKQDIFADLY